MKKKVAIIASAIVLLSVVMLAFLSSRSVTYTDVGSLVEKAREVIPISDADSIDISFAGQTEKDGKVLMWFVSGNEYQSHYYLPMECIASGSDKYKFERTYKPMNYSDDIAVLEWSDGYAFVVNDPTCKSVHIEGESGTVNESLEDKSYPYVFYYDGLPTRYIFSDA